MARRWAGWQYWAFSGIAHGRHTHRLFEKLITGGFATTDLAPPAHAGRLYHLQYKPWYRLLGEPDHRHRRPMSVGRAVERLMVLDGVLAVPDVTWLGLTRDKVASFTNPPFCVPPNALPQTTVAGVVRPVTTGRFQFFAIGGFGMWGETVAGGKGTGAISAKDLGLGVTIAGSRHLRVRLDYRLFMLGQAEEGESRPSTRHPQRFSAGIHLVF